MNKKGFTLMELMVVILIIAILTAIALPMYQSSVDAQNNARARSVLEVVNGGLERFHREYPSITMARYVDTETSLPVTVSNPPEDTVCTYRGQTVVPTGAVDENQINLSDFIAQLIACGYIPRYNYGTSVKAENDMSLDYRFILQDPDGDGACGFGYVIMQPKPDAQGKVKVGNKFCMPVNGECQYKACINRFGKAVDAYNN